MAERAPGEWALRPARGEDYSAFARLFLELGVPESPPPEAGWAAELMPLTLVLEGPGGLLAYVAADALGELGYVVQLVVAPEARRQGLGRRLLAVVADRFREQGCRSWALNVKKDNTAAIELYTALGMRPVRESVTLAVSRAQAEVLPAAPEGLEVVPVVASEWEPLTAAFQLLPGKLERFAKRGSHQLLRLARAGAPERMDLGMMDLRPGNVLFPFFAASSGHAHALLLEAFQRTGAEAFHVSVTDDAPLVGLLRGAGAIVKMEIQQMQGPLR
ncbi:GNAT family N-acetyltransferase [Hyalangium versicolor]|uniref:GNAT family N-acetyltransferase n=1 Tax=Hyalangium versicolor TaxID=2861190 RepID=UPI001CCDBA28|nr:GNAT family N-acetyltransferase [Hyalangium versicolor]